jgi:hypothetical protein
MTWYTCIVHVPLHVSPVSWFHTRAASPDEARQNAARWFLNGEESQWGPDDVDVPLVFEGRLQPHQEGEDN